VAFDFSGFSQLSNCGAPMVGHVEFDLGTNAAVLRAAWKMKASGRASPAGPELRDTGDTAYLPMDAGGPFLSGSGWTWCGARRVAANGTTDSVFPVLHWQERKHTPQWLSFYALNDSQVLAVARDSLWLLTLLETTAKENP
jgi:hypothetical protein